MFVEFIQQFTRKLQSQTVTDVAPKAIAPRHYRDRSVNLPGGIAARRARELLMLDMLKPRGEQGKAKSGEPAD